MIIIYLLAEKCSLKWLMPKEYVFSSNIPTDSQKVFDGRDNVFKEGTVFDFWFILECAGYIQNVFA